VYDPRPWDDSEPRPGPPWFKGETVPRHHQNVREDDAEEWAIAQLTAIIELSDARRDALPGSAVAKIKEARLILRKRRATTRQRVSKAPGLTDGRHERGWTP
jgi:hypothetical protein